MPNKTPAQANVDMETAEYVQLLEECYRVMLEEVSRLAFLDEGLFEFMTCDDEMSDLFATKATEVCEAINNGKTF